MSDASSEKPQRQTWIDWLSPENVPPESEWVTLDQLLASLAQEGMLISKRTMRYWESTGRLPRPVKRWRDKAMFALYPPFHKNFVIGVAHGLIGIRDPRNTYVAESFAWAMERWAESHNAGLWFFGNEEIQNMIDKIATLYQQAHGERPAGGVLILQNAEGKPLQQFAFKTDDYKRFGK
jgi:hypothetical protein